MDMRSRGFVCYERLSHTRRAKGCRSYEKPIRPCMLGTVTPNYAYRLLRSFRPCGGIFHRRVKTSQARDMRWFRQPSLYPPHETYV